MATLEPPLRLVFFLFDAIKDLNKLANLREKAVRSFAAVAAPLTASGSGPGEIRPVQSAVTLGNWK
jgi:hypothetical protein